MNDQQVEFSSINEKRSSPKYFNGFFRRKSFDDRTKPEDHHQQPTHSHSLTILPTEQPLNKFLQEIRSKRREFQLKAKNLSIDQRIASYRRAQNLYSVHFHLREDDDDDDDDDPNEEFQEKIREDIFNELNRQRLKQDKKDSRHRFIARFLLFLILIILFSMSCTLIFTVSHLIHRVDHFNLTSFVNLSNVSSYSK